MSLIHFLILLAMVFMGGYIIGKSIEYICKFKEVKYRNIYWIIVFLSLFICIILRSIWASYISYLIIFLVIFNIITIINKLLKFDRLNDYLKHRVYFIYLASGLVVVYGIINATIPYVNKVNIDIENLNQKSTIAFASDIHLGTSRLEMIDKLVSEVDKINPDIFVIGGDLYDENTNPKIIEESIAKISKIKTNYGIYYIEGNHDLLTDKVNSYLEKYNIKVLDDEVELINNNYYIIGRRDKKDKDRHLLKNLTENLENYPKIVLDHQPITKELKENNIDLQLSGHTHGGQIWPFNYILPHGYYESKKLYVSYGYGVWHNPVRTSGHQEILVINLY